MPLSKRELKQLLPTLEGALLRAFVKDIKQIVKDAKPGAIESLIAAGDVDQIMRVLNITPTAFAGMVEAMRTTYMISGQQETASIPRIPQREGHRAKVRFDVRNPRAEEWLLKESSELITGPKGIIEGHRESIRKVISEGSAIGRHPRATALDIVGRKSSVTGERKGGIIGLSANQAEYVSTARSQLSSGDPKQMAAYLDRAARNKNMDGVVNRAIKAGKPVATADVDRLAGAYSDRLLKLRGESIARTESMAAFSAARDESYAQAIEQGLDKKHVTKAWDDAGDARVRHDHTLMNGQKRRFDEPFVMPAGAKNPGVRFRFPGDRTLGAPAEEVIQCRCRAVYRIDHLGAANA